MSDDAEESGIVETSFGSGMTVRRRITHNLLTPDGKAAYLAELAAGRFDFDKNIESYEEAAKFMLRKAGLPDEGSNYVKENGKWVHSENGGMVFWAIPLADGYAEDSPPGYAQRILFACIKLKSNMKKGQVEEIAWNAYELGTLITESTMKWSWERSALHGRAMRRAGAPNLARHNRRTTVEQEAKWATWQAEADRVWARHPSWSTARAATEISRNLGLQNKVETIRKRIKRK